MAEFERVKKAEFEVCNEMLRSAFRALRVAERVYGISRFEVASREFKSLIERIKAKNAFYCIGEVRCVVPEVIADYIRDIEKIRLTLLDEKIKRQYHNS